MNMTQHRFYEGRPVAFLTQHGKQDLVREPLEAALGCQLVHTDAYDTDQLGTFTRELTRAGSQLDTARKKATLGMALTGASVGMASEGSFGPDPFGAFMPWNTEVVLWVDPLQEIEITGFAHGPAQSLHRMVKSLQELERFATEAGFPEHHLVLRPENPDHPDMDKGLRDRDALVNAFVLAQAKSANGVVFVENDLRAFCNPTRQKTIVKATGDLIQKLLSVCPSCESPGYWLSQQVPGLPCRDCGSLTRLPKAEIWGCKKCGHEEQKTTNAQPWADPARCDFCNP
ncbi:DUF6671 family protein [Limnohabitans sp. 63ED37-2]|uniref:DUF6671 family protein n=1 Tax=Limnohabitans sp. 63ED37-2 TaxID=1678128 RepID=UPI000706B397|nr:DUF6671 family protein [Limnohabitans sp. 63ED37-2]ALK90223.1 hypothetical protein L63ED372_03025 [Limnohabitans sp. 63ED37-2]